MAFSGWVRSKCCANFWHSAGWRVLPCLEAIWAAAEDIIVVVVWCCVVWCRVCVLVDVLVYQDDVWKSSMCC